MTDEYATLFTVLGEYIPRGHVCRYFSEFSTESYNREKNAPETRRLYSNYTFQMHCYLMALKLTREKRMITIDGKEYRVFFVHGGTSTMRTMMKTGFEHDFDADTNVDSDTDTDNDAWVTTDSESEHNEVYEIDSDGECDLTDETFGSVNENEQAQLPTCGFIYGCKLKFGVSPRDLDLSNKNFRLFSLGQ